MDENTSFLCSDMIGQSSSLHRWRFFQCNFRVARYIYSNSTKTYQKGHKSGFFSGKITPGDPEVFGRVVEYTGEKGRGN